MPVTVMQLVDFLKGALSGDYDGQPFRAVSVAASGHKRFVIKGWVGETAIRFTCPWGHLGSGEASVISSTGTLVATETSANISLAGVQLTLKVSFELPDGTDHVAHYHCKPK